MTFTEKKFNIPDIEGISKKTIEEHLKLYTGYVKHSNLIIDKIKEYQLEGDKHAYAIAELQRRFGFEFDGMRNHEYYFEQLEGGPKRMSMESLLMKQVEKDFGSSEAWLERFKAICMTRGIGWAVLLWDKKNQRLLNTWVDEQHLGHLTGLDFIYGVDMWEHSYMLDYVPGDKKKYIESYIMATNQEVCAERFLKVQ